MKQILIIEDDKSISEIQKDYLEMSGYKVICAYAGEEGLKILQQQKVDLAVLDLMLPKTDGMEILRQIGENKDFPIVVLSAKGEEMSKIKALNLGADVAVYKRNIFSV